MPYPKTSKLEAATGRVLQDAFGNAVVRQARPAWLRNTDTNRGLSFDFYIPEAFVAIEVDGVQHEKPIEWFIGSRTGDANVTFNDFVFKDRCKDITCQWLGIELIRIRSELMLDTIIDKVQAAVIYAANTKSRYARLFGRSIVVGSYIAFTVSYQMIQGMYEFVCAECLYHSTRLGIINHIKAYHPNADIASAMFYAPYNRHPSGRVYRDIISEHIKYLKWFAGDDAGFVYLSELQERHPKSWKEICFAINKPYKDIYEWYTEESREAFSRKYFSI